MMFKKKDLRSTQSTGERSTTLPSFWAWGRMMPSIGGSRFNWKENTYIANSKEDPTTINIDIQLVSDGKFARDD